jgi:hypothetical protein
MTGVVYVLTHDPKERLELFSSVLAQAVTAVAYSVMDGKYRGTY